MAGNLDSADNVRALSQTDINKLNNAQLKKALSVVLDAQRNEPNEVLTELREIKASIQEFSAVKAKVRDLSNQLSNALQIIHQQQLFLESIENRERRCNLVITGLREVADDVGRDDPEKLQMVLNKAKCPSDIDASSFALCRLGQPNEHQKRPLLVICNSQQQRGKIIQTASELKRAGETYTRIYIKKDIHPTVRKEIGRLRKRAKEEEEKSANTGTIIAYDPKNRVVTRDGVVIDRFSPKFF